MSGGSSASDRIFRITNAAVALAPVPWLGTVVVGIREICDIIKQIKLVKPECLRLTEEVTGIATTLKNHHDMHPGDSKLEGVRDALSLIVTNIKIDLLHWKNYNKIAIFFMYWDVLEKIKSHRTALDAATRGLTIAGILSQDIDSAKREQDAATIKAQLAQAGQDADAMKAQLTRVEQFLEKQAQETARVKEEYQKARIIGIDKLGEATEQIFALRLDPESFPSEDMQGEVRKDGPNAKYIAGDTFDVFKAKWLDKKWVAAKRLRDGGEGFTKKQEERFIRQMNIWRTFKEHPHIVPVLGICKFEEELPPYIISPWMKYGNVRNYLKQFSDQADRIRLIHEVALGLQYLHSIGILHGNLNGSNVLVNINHRVRLTGFSLSKRLEGNLELSKSRGDYELFRWWSPELLNDGMLSEQSDIWSWGMTALEILSGERPFRKKAGVALVTAHLTETSLPKPEDYEREIATEQVWTLMKDCWKPCGSRPHIDHMVGVLHAERVLNGWDPNAPPPEPNVDPDFPEAF